MSGTHRESRNTVPMRTAVGLADYAVHSAKAKELYDAEFAGNPPELRPRWESQPLESRVPWLNKAARQLAAANR